jgi:hypothetical protein
MTYHSITTLAEIRAAGPCEDGWQKLLKHLGKTKADDEPLSLMTILESNGLEDALWCMRVPSLERLSRHFQAWCAEQVLHHFEAKRPGDTRVRDQIAMLRRDDATDAERDAARAAARDATDVPEDAAWAAARAAALDAALAAAWAATGAATLVAAAVVSPLDAAWAAAWGAQEGQLRAMIGGEK